MGAIEDKLIEEAWARLEFNRLRDKRSELDKEVKKAFEILQSKKVELKGLGFKGNIFRDNIALDTPP